MISGEGVAFRERLRNGFVLWTRCLAIQLIGCGNEQKFQWYRLTTHISLCQEVETGEETYPAVDLVHFVLVLIFGFDHQQRMVKEEELQVATISSLPSTFLQITLIDKFTALLFQSQILWAVQDNDQARE